MYFLYIMYHDWHILEHITDIIMITLHTDQKVAISAMRYEDARKASSSQVVSQAGIEIFPGDYHLGQENWMQTMEG